MVELDNILINVGTILHGQTVQLMLCISDWVVWTEVGCEFEDELLIVVGP